MRRTTRNALLATLAMVAASCGGQRATPAAATGAHPPARTPAPAAHHPAAGGRVATHGMVLFGRDSFYLAHIPTFEPPHDHQLVMKVRLELPAGSQAPAGFSDRLYTVKPGAPFSLDDLIAGANGLTSFAGDIHDGNFEHGGPVAVAGVRFAVEKVLVSRRLSADTAADPTTTYLVFGGAGDRYAVNRITAAADVQRVLAVSVATAPGELGASETEAVAVELPGVEPLGLTATQTARVRGRAVQVTVIGQLSCLRGPDFYSKKC